MEFGDGDRISEFLNYNKFGLRPRIPHPRHPRNPRLKSSSAGADRIWGGDDFLRIDALACNDGEERRHHFLPGLITPVDGSIRIRIGAVIRGRSQRR